MFAAATRSGFHQHDDDVFKGLIPSSLRKLERVAVGEANIHIVNGPKGERSESSRP